MSFIEGLKNMFSQNGTRMAEDWNILADNSAVEDAIRKSEEKPQLIYKHSGRCSVCVFAKSNLEHGAEEISEVADMNFVDVIASRGVSNYIAEKLNVRHESPQAILLDQGKVIWHDSHGSVKSAKILDQVG